MYIIARQGTRVPESVHVYTIKNAHIDICKYASIDKGLCSRFDVKFVTANSMYAQFGPIERPESKHTLSRVASGHYRNSLQ